MRTPLGRMVNLWQLFGMLLEFGPLFGHLRFVHGAMRQKNASLVSSDVGVTDSVFDPLREIIVEYLIRGINRAMLKWKQEGIYESQKYYETLAHRGTVRCPAEGEVGPNIDESDIKRISAEEDVHCFAFQRNANQEKLDSEEFLLDDAKKLEKYVQITVIAPNLFSLFRNYFGIDDNIVATTFSTDKLRSGDLRIKLGSGKGGSFFIYPPNARFLLKAISRRELHALHQILPSYFLHIVQCRHSGINPVIALFTIDIKGENMIEPVHFMLMPNVLPFDRASLSEDTKMLAFDIKGSLGQRFSTAKPEALLNLDALTKADLGLTYKDLDFMKSYRTLELDRTEALPILAQLRKDTQLLSEAKIFDYSIVLFLVATPLIESEDILAARLSAQDFHPQSVARFAYAKRQASKENPCGIVVRLWPARRITIKYTTNLCTLLFHICNPADMEALRGFMQRNVKSKQRSRLVVEERKDVVKEHIIPEETKEEKKVVDDHDQPAHSKDDLSDTMLFDFKRFPMTKKCAHLVNFPKQVVRGEQSHRHCEDCKVGCRDNHYVVVNAKVGLILTHGIEGNTEPRHPAACH